MGLLLILTRGLAISLLGDRMFVIWLGLEINMFGIIPFINRDDKDNIFFRSPSEMKVAFYYFFVQVMGSLLFLCGCILRDWFIIGCIGLLIKLGIPPFHQWVPILISRLDWFCIGLVRTIQKLPGIVLLRLLFDIEFRTCLFISLLGLLISAIGINMSYRNIKKLIGWSSIRNMSILIFLMALNWRWGVTYYFFYTALVITFCFIIKFFPLVESKIKVYRFVILIFSGAPPFLGFLVKLYFLRGVLVHDSYFGIYNAFLIMAPYYLESFEVGGMYMLLVVLQSVGYIRAFINEGVRKDDRINKTSKSNYRIFLRLYILSMTILMMSL